MSACRFRAAQRIAAQLRGPAAAEHRPGQTLRRQAPRHHDAAPLGRGRCSTLIGRRSDSGGEHLPRAKRLSIGWLTLIVGVCVSTGEPCYAAEAE
jgi:hypothetical protein